MNITFLRWFFASRGANERQPAGLQVYLCPMFSTPVFASQVQSVKCLEFCCSYFVIRGRALFGMLQADYLRNPTLPIDVFKSYLKTLILNRLKIFTASFSIRGTISESEGGTCPPVPSCPNVEPPLVFSVFGISTVSCGNYFARWWLSARHGTAATSASTRLV